MSFIVYFIALIVPSLFLFLFFPLSISSFFGTPRGSRLILFFPCPNPGISLSPKETWFFYQRRIVSVTKSKVLSVCLVPLGAITLSVDRFRKCTHISP